MTERGLPTVDGAPACPFVAFEDDRDERATSPDHRHRCYAEVRPAPRALAHQEAYCLSSAFPVCPTFQDWARREAAHARSVSRAQAPNPDDPPQRNPPRDWSAPPPWAGSGPPPGTGPADLGYEDDDEDDAEAPGFLIGRPGPAGGLAGSAADRLAGGDRADPERPAERERARPIEDRPAPAGAASREPEAEAPEQPPTPPFFARPGRGDPPRPAARPERDPEDDWDDDDDERYERRQAARGGGGPGRDRRPKVGDTRRPRPSDPGPSWERPRRYEAYPTLKTRMGFPAVPRVGVMAIALVLAAVVLFFVGPQLLGIGRPSGPAGVNPSPSPSAGVQPSVSVAPTPVPAPTPQIYRVQAGDTMSRIANRFGIPLDELIEANRDSIPDPDNLQIDDEVIIPAVPPDEIGESPAASVAP